jgi:hypothetical protein
MTVPSDLSSLTIQQLRELQGSAIQEIAQAQSLDYISASRIAKGQYGQLWTEGERRANDAARNGQQPVLSNSQLAAIPQPSQDTQSLYRNATSDEWNAIWKACKNSCDPSKASIGYDSLVDSVMRSRGLPNDAATQDVRTRFPALSSLAHSQKAALKLGVELPTVSTPGNPSWSPRTGASTPSGIIKPTPALKKTFTVGNDADVNCGLDAVKRGWDDKFPEPLTQQSRSLVKYIVTLLTQTDPMPNTVPAYSLAVLQKKLNSPTVSEAALADAEADAKENALGNSRFAALANSDDLEEIKAYAKANGLAVMVQGKRGLEMAT